MNGSVPLSHPLLPARPIVIKGRSHAQVEIPQNPPVRITISRTYYHRKGTKSYSDNNQPKL